MKLIKLISLILMFSGCSNLSPNEGQIQKSISNFSCYATLLLEIKTDSELIKKIIEIRNKKRIGNFDPITVKQEFRLIELNEIESLLSDNWIDECKITLEEENDFRGIRVASREQMIIEMDKFERYTLTETHSKDRTIEFHRLIFGNFNFEKESFYFGNEKRIWQDTIANDMIYEITQQKIHM